MRIQTAEDLNDFLSAEIAWRKKELYDLRSLVLQNPQNARNSLIRSGVTALYAHWEGFVRASATAYLEYVARRKLTCHSLASNFLALALRPKLNQALTSSRIEAFVDVVEFLVEQISSTAKIEWRGAINTKSNLSSKVFREILRMLGLDYSYYASKEKVIDEKLLRSRNNIAHGKNLTMDKESFLELHDEVWDLMNNLRNQIDNAAATGGYRRN